MFNEKDIEALTLGEIIKRQRESKKIDLKKLSEVTGISVRNLKKLEEGDYESLPAEIYIESFISKCEKHLGFEDGQLLYLYKNERKQVDRIQDQNVSKISTKSFVLTPKIIWKILAVSVALIILVYFSIQLSYLLGAPKLVVINPESDIITESKEIVISGSTQPDNKVTINNNDIFVDREGGFSETIPLQEGVNTIEVKSVNRFGKESSVIRRIMLQVINN